MSVELILGSPLGSVIAPAGCGKTHLLTQVLLEPQLKPVLVLTHTTAGVAALKKRLNQMSVPAKNYVLATIDGWALRMINYFPQSCPISCSPNTPQSFYPAIRASVANHIRTRVVDDLLVASYSHVLVDEYQDCNIDQHELILSLAQHIPTVIFGDPMQGIFTFAGPVPDWTREVLVKFPVICTLTVPHRWDNAGASALGNWLLTTRTNLENGHPIDLRTCPDYVNWHPLTGNTQHDLRDQTRAQYSIFGDYPNDSLLIIGESTNESSRHSYAQSSSGIDVVEPVQMTGLIHAANLLEQHQGLNLVEAVLSIATSLMTNVEKSKLLLRIPSIIAGKNRTPATVLESELVALSQNKATQTIHAVFKLCSDKPGVRVYRKGALYSLLESLNLASTTDKITITKAAETVRERIRQQGDRRIPRRAIGSTLLLKGLEADHCLILNADSRTMDRKNLYVALTRGAKTVSIFSRSPIISV